MKTSISTYSNVKTTLESKQLSLGYKSKTVSKNLSVKIPDGRFTIIVGPNACGKSTLLRALCRLHQPQSGHVFLDGKNIQQYNTKTVAKQIGLLPQSSTAPEGITVKELVSRGRYPHQSLFQQWSSEDKTAVTNAMISTDTLEIANMAVDELSGGQRQRVWVAMLLAQKTPILLLDEPTTYLDISHQIELLDLFHYLNKQHNQTIVAVLHDLNHACRYADHIIMMKDGSVIAEGNPKTIMTASLINTVFGLACSVIQDPITNTPMIIPRSPKKPNYLIKQ